MFAGIDTHKDTLAIAVINAAGGPVIVVEVPNTLPGFEKIGQLLATYPVERIGVEGSGNYGRAVAAHLVCGGLDVREVPTLMTSRERGAQPGKGKTDEVDAVAIAKITGRETGLPPVRLTVGLAADLRALLDYREDLIREHTMVINQVHAELTGLFPGYQHQHPHLVTFAQVNAVLGMIGDDQRVRADVCRRRLRRALELTVEAREIKRRITAMIKGKTDHVAGLYGAGPIIAARFVAEVVDVSLYPNRDAFASANGTAPLAASSGRTVRHRLNRGGNRSLNRALYTMAITQIRGDTEGRAYYLRKRAEGKTSKEAIRCLKRQLSDQVFKAMRRDASSPALLPGPAIEPDDTQALVA